MVHQVAQPHDPQANPPRPVGGLLELRNCRHVGVGFYHVIQEDRRQPHALAQLLPIYAAIRPKVLGQVDRAQAAVLVGPKQLLAAWIGCFKLVQVRNRVGAVGGVQEEHSRFAIVVRLAYDLLEQVPRPDRLVAP